LEKDPAQRALFSGPGELDRGRGSPVSAKRFEAVTLRSPRHKAGHRQVKPGEKIFDMMYKKSK
jgi:hypothetical protein